MIRNAIEAEAHFHRGNTLSALEQFEPAVSCYDAAINARPDHAGAYSNRGLALAGLKRWDAALASFDRAIAIQPDLAEAHSNRGNVLMALKRWDAALAGFDRAITLRAGYTEAHYNRGNALLARKEAAAALASYDAAIALQPDHAQAYCNRGLAQGDLGQWAAALSSFDRAIEIKSDFAEAHSNRGNALTALEQWQAALASYERALELNGDLAETFSNRGNVLTALDRYEDALRSYDRAVAIHGDFADAYFNRACLKLLRGDWEGGWPDYEWRHRRERSGVPNNARPHQSRPLWLGKESLSGRTILLHGEQGLGDTIQFCRYATEVAALGAKVILVVPRPLVRLLSSLAGVWQLIAQDSEPPDFDYQCPLLSLPLAFKTRLETIPRPTRYLSAARDIAHRWRLKLGASRGLRVGLVWSGNRAHPNNHRRSIPLAELIAALPDRCEYVSLQKDLNEQDLQTLRSNPRILDVSHALSDFRESAAVCECMDLVISVDTSVAHLSAALGGKTWILLPRHGDWRWLLNRSDSPWYSSATLYRQERSGDWSTVLRRIRADLEILAAQPRHFDSLNMQGVIALQTGHPETALTLLTTAIEIDPNHAAARFNLGAVLQQLNRTHESLASYDAAIAIEPAYAEAFCNRGLALARLGRWRAALASYEQAIAIKPRFAEAHFNRGLVLSKLEEAGPALASFDRAIELQPGFAEAHYNRGLVLAHLTEVEASLSSYDRAVALRPGYVEAHQNRSWMLLLSGDLARGWVDYEWRWKAANGADIEHKREFRRPLWLGDASIAGKTILLHAEQGLGDTLQFCRYATQVAGLGARVILEVPPSLAPLLRHLDGVGALVGHGTALPEFDFHCPLLSLPLAFKTTLDSIPASPGYLRADPAKSAHWRGVLAEQSGVRVGLAWSGSKLHKNDHNRSIPLAELVRHLPAGITYVSLQKDLRDTDRRVLESRPDVMNVADALHDFGDTAALCACVDVVISVDTSIAHLGGALGRQTWILLPYHADWRWLTDRDDSPWYPSVRLYRQARAGDWNDVLARIRDDLGHWPLTRSATTDQSNLTT